MTYRRVDDWSDLDAWLDFQAVAVNDQLADLPDGSTVLFTAHSLPERVLEGDPYPEVLAASAAAIADRAGLDRWALAWQSAGRTPEPWRGPDVLEVIDDLATPGLLVCAQGFTSDHLEILYDLDIEAAARAESAGHRLRPHPVGQRRPRGDGGSGAVGARPGVATPTPRQPRGRGIGLPVGEATRVHSEIDERHRGNDRGVGTGPSSSGADWRPISQTVVGWPAFPRTQRI